MTKSKNTLIPQGEALLTTPLSISDCVQRLREMKHFDLTVSVLRQSKHSAQIQFIERHNDDLPLYVTSRMMATNDGTRVSFELSEYLRERTSQTPEPPKKLTTKQWELLGGMVIISVITLMGGYANPEMVWSTILCIVPVTVVLFLVAWQAVSPVDETPTQMGQRSNKIKSLMRQRADVLRAEIIDTLTIDPDDEHYDELGNAYYLDLSDKSKRGQS